LAGKGCKYSIDTQVNLFCTLVRLYNFGKQYREEDIFDKAILTTESQGQVDNLVVVSTGNK
jgi:hypothetical protein